MKVIDDDASLLPKIGADGFPLRGTVTRARDYTQRWGQLEKRATIHKLRDDWERRRLPAYRAG